MGIAKYVEDITTKLRDDYLRVSGIDEFEPNPNWGRAEIEKEKLRYFERSHAHLMKIKDIAEILIPELDRLIELATDPEVQAADLINSLQEDLDESKRSYSFQTVKLEKEVSNNKNLLESYRKRPVSPA